MINTQTIQPILPPNNSLSGYPKPDYVQLYDEVDNSILRFPVYDCSFGFVKGKCDCGKEYVAKIDCCKEWCPICGIDRSMIHNRRISRWIPKIQQINSVGYMVITTPEIIRSRIDKKFLSAFRLFVKRKLIREYDVTRGLMRYHWAGNCKCCEGNGCTKCNYTGSSDIFYPHLNLLLDCKYISKVKLSRLKTDVKRYINRYFHLKMITPVVINYRYTKLEVIKRHWVKYVTRSTWKYGQNVNVTNLIRKYKNSNTFGKFDKIVAEKNEDDPKGRCVCGCEIDWKGGYMNRALFNRDYKVIHAVDDHLLMCEIDQPPEFVDHFLVENDFSIFLA